MSDLALMEKLARVESVEVGVWSKQDWWRLEKELPSYLTKAVAALGAAAKKQDQAKAASALGDLLFRIAKAVTHSPLDTDGAIEDDLLKVVDKFPEQI